MVLTTWVHVSKMEASAGKCVLCARCIFFKSVAIVVRVSVVKSDSSVRHIVRKSLRIIDTTLLKLKHCGCGFLLLF